jgi:serine/threonine protein kinase
LTTAAVGSAGYIPHEVLNEPKLRTVLHDVYSCAVITYELISRRRPNPQQYIPLASQCEELAALDKVLIRALGPVDGRPATATSLRNDILAARPD